MLHSILLLYLGDVLFSFQNFYFIRFFPLIGVVITALFLLASILLGRIDTMHSSEPYRASTLLMREHRDLVQIKIAFAILPQLIGLGPIFLVPFSFEYINLGAYYLPFISLLLGVHLYLLLPLFLSFTSSLVLEGGG